MQAADSPTGSGVLWGRDSPSVPGLVRLLAFGVMRVIPLRVLGTDFLLPDDALRHAAKTVSGRSWPEMLVLRSDVTVDPHPGWHALGGHVPPGSRRP